MLCSAPVYMGAKSGASRLASTFAGGLVVAGQSVAGGVNDPLERSGRTLGGRDDEIVETHVFAREVFLVAIGLRHLRKLEGSGGGLGHQRLSGCAPEVLVITCTRYYCIPVKQVKNPKASFARTSRRSTRESIVQ